MQTNWPPPPVQPDPTPRREYRSPRRLAALLRWAFAGNVVAAGLWAAAGVADHRLLVQLDRAPTSVSVDEALSSDARSSALLVAVFVLLVATAGVFIVWTRRLYRNLAALGISGQRFGEGWAVGGWFVPFLSFVRPKQILNDIWRATEPDETAHWNWHQNRVSPLLHWWWASWLVFAVLARTIGDAAGDIAAARGEVDREVMVAIVLAVSAVLALIVVGRLTDRQERRAARRGLVMTSIETDTRRHWPGLAWLAPIFGVAVFAAAFTILDAPGSQAGGSARAERTSDGTVATRGSVLWSELRVGDCFDDPPDVANAALAAVTVLGVEVLPCNEPHDNEVFAVLRHPDAAPAAFPGDDALTDYAVAHCLEPFTAWVGIPVDESSLDVTFFWPETTGWAAGDRTIVCAAYRLDLQKLDASVRDARI